VVDNGSTDGTPAWLSEFTAQAAARDVPVTVIENDDNIGCSTARNQGWQAATGNHVLFVDNDVALRSRDGLEQLSSHLEEGSGVAVAGPKLVYPFAPYDIQCAGVAVSPNGRIQFMGRGEARNDERFNVEREVQCLISACFLVARPALEAAGGFDEAFNPVEYEDLDLCYRIRASGQRCRYVPTVEMYHFESVTTAGTPSLPNTRLIIEHGLLFKKRWRHMFEREGGPPDEETRWREVPTRRWDEVGELPIV
jgi:GT2 family glycosyltransferase